MSGGESRPHEDDEAHDVLAAEAFAVPAADPSLSRRPITLPDDPSGIAEPHDILAAEEFAMPATRGTSAPAGPAARLAAKTPLPVRIVALAAVALGLLRALQSRRRHGQS
ncbi:MAG: hypothetical protein JO304_02695 [Solirubrobacterales bacterium]|nr:hypothetical protein [Solirubrobacterales bacterium]